MKNGIITKCVTFGFLELETNIHTNPSLSSAFISDEFKDVDIDKTKAIEIVKLLNEFIENQK
tara:strand:- start:535 stop:720 length:186 start_codon:yes stop_codon:yes gene_type:complete